MWRCLHVLALQFIMPSPLRQHSSIMFSSLFLHYIHLSSTHNTLSLLPTHQPFPKMLLYEVYLKHSCRILVAANHDPHYHFFVTCNGMDSSNIVSTRGELHTEDCIPPMHRCVVFSYSGTSLVYAQCMMTLHTVCVCVHTLNNCTITHSSSPPSPHQPTHTHTHIHRQVILVITQLEVSQPYSVSMRIEFNSSRTNAAGEWGATHWPELHQDIMELHSPRLILS